MSHTQPLTGINNLASGQSRKSRNFEENPTVPYSLGTCGTSFKCESTRNRGKKQTKNPTPQQKIPKQTNLQNQTKKLDGEGTFSLCQQLKQSPNFLQVIVSTPRNIFIPFDELKDTGREQILEKFNFYPKLKYSPWNHSYLNLLGKPPLCPAE